uniref:Uncharacterized protein n=1 Tax=Anguilla anguilla TaxID=7936 RepID=A0A0E9W3V1_ANGAN
MATYSPYGYFQGLKNVAIYLASDLPKRLSKYLYKILTECNSTDELQINYLI